MQANQQQEELGDDLYENEGYQGGFWAAHDQHEQAGGANDGQEYFGDNAQGADIQAAPIFNNNQGAAIQEAPNNNNNQDAGIQAPPI